MKLADFGPEPIQVTGYFAGKPPSSPGGIRGVTKAEDFYNATRRQAKPWAYSVFCVAAPAAVLASALLFIANAFSKLLTLGSPVVSIERFCVSPFFGRPLANVVTASALHFAVTHVVLLTACVVAFALAAQVIRNVMAIHVPLAGWTGVVAVATPLVGGAAVFGAMQSYFGKAVGALFGSEATFAQWNADVTKMPCLKEALDAAGTLDAHAYWGVLAVALSVVALALAAATIAFRFETDNIDGKWADSYVLRHKRYALLTLFLVASVVLVVTNIALSSYTDFAANVFGEIETSGIACFPPATADAQPELVKPRCPTTKAPATKKGGANKEKRPEPAQSAGEPPKPVAELSKPVAELFVQAKSLRKTLLNLAGGLASLTLVAMFLPAFLGLMSDIEIAGKTHAAAAAQPAAAPFNVASWKDVNAWKNDHGLSLEFSDVATALVAVAAPLLSNGVFDLSKSLLVFH